MLWLYLVASIVTGCVPAATDFRVLTPEMAYTNEAYGCGDIFVYKSNRAKSEYLKFSIPNEGCA